MGRESCAAGASPAVRQFLTPSSTQPAVSSVSPPLVPQSSPTTKRWAERPVEELPSVPRPAGNKMPSARPPEDMMLTICNAVHAAVRDAVREELEAQVSSNGSFRGMLRSELSASMKGSPRRTMTHSNEEISFAGDLDQFDWDIDAGDPEQHPVFENSKGHAVCSGSQQHFADFLNSLDKDTAVAHRRTSVTMLLPEHSVVRSLPGNTFLVRLVESYVWLTNLEEPERIGWLASIVTSTWFELMVSAIIFLHCPFMVYAADSAIRDPRREVSSESFEYIGEWLFQLFYTVELMLKLAVHGWYFLCNDSWKLNLFDLGLVLQGYAHLLLDTTSRGTFLRVLRLVKLGKALRALKAMAQLRHLRAILVCLQGSFTSFVWSLVMLASVFFLFSLFFVQLTAAHLAEQALTVDGDLEVLFGSVAKSMLTLYKASTGGDDWSFGYDVIAQVGQTGAFMYLIFIAFVQLALINIITGIFVESAMQTLAPDREAAAFEHDRQEKEYAHDLAHLCKLVDDDRSGKLTPTEFEHAIRQGRVPSLLMLMGLSKHHVLQFFRTMAALSSDENGEVDIQHFVAGCMRLKGAATNFDLQLLHAEVRSIQLAQENALKGISEHLSRLRTHSDRAEKFVVEKWPTKEAHETRQVKGGICKSPRRSPSGRDSGVSQ